MEKRTYVAFEGSSLIASGELRSTLLQSKQHIEKNPNSQLLFFEDQTGKQLEFDLRGTDEEALARLDAHPHFVDAPPPARSGPGRPKLGVVCREISLLPRHWEWLDRQPGGPSVTLRKLVEDALRQDTPSVSRDTLYKFMSAIAGNLSGFEEASRALYAKDDARFTSLIQCWPESIQSHLLYLLGEARHSEDQKKTKAR
jgi:hypothetical protein